MMNVLFLANTFPSPDNRNTSPFNLRSVKNLSASGLNVRVVHLRSWKPGRKTIDEYDMDGVKVVAVSFPFYVGFPKRLLALNIYLYKKLLASRSGKILKDFKPDVIHSVGAGHAGIVGSHLSKKKNIPHVAQCIGSDINVVMPSFKSFFGVKNWDRYVSCFACNSKALAVAVKELYPSAETRVIYRGVNLKDFSPAPAKLTANEIVFSFIGGFSIDVTEFGKNEKGGITLLKAWKEVYNKRENKTGFKLNFGGPRMDIDLVKETLQCNPEGMNIEVIGHVNKEKVVDLFQRSHVVIIASMFEGLPNVGMEAAASGCAIIGTEVGGVPEIVRDNQTGLLIPRNNIDALADAINKLLDDVQLLSQMRAASRPMVEQSFDAANFAKEYSNLYQYAIERSKN